MSCRIAAASIIGPIQALKDQGMCRSGISYTVKCLQNQVANKYSSPSIRETLKSFFSRDSGQLGYSDESLRTVMFISSWAPT